MAPHEDNMRYLNLAVRAACARRRGSGMTQVPKDTRPVKRDSSGQIRRSLSECAGVPFGPNLIPVRCEQERTDVEDRSSGNSEPGSAVGHKAIPGLLHRRGDCSGGRPESSHAVITTNDLLECLVHPEIIARVTELLLDRTNVSQPL